MKARIIVNPISGGGRSIQMAERLGARLLRMGYEVSQYETRKSDGQTERGRRLARRGRLRRQEAAEEEPCPVFPGPCDLAVAIGGDGTINLALNRLPDDGPPLAVLPTGTANVLARELSLTRDVNVLCRLIESGSTVQVDTMQCGSRRFLLMAGAGLDAEVTRLMGLQRKGTLSFLSYGGPLVRALRRYRAAPIAVEVDGKQVAANAALVIVTNVSTYGGPLVIAPQADPCDGLFDVCVIRSRSRMRLLALAAQALARKRLDQREVQYVTGKRITLSSSGRVPLQVDGDFLQYLPATVEIARRKVRIVAPPRTG